ncbi:Hypothetical predicted protein [Cloeon dipterum]|uniref:KIX domain-containing protein n=1 Tax=Cloeon dipterum TaxID=197152 RepID=A0A8S1DA23_9INSE|nr:Hypothetical predicted protein [Cloeon dipterum]
MEDWKKSVSSQVRQIKILRLLHALCSFGPNCDRQSDTYIFMSNYVRTIETGIFEMSNDRDHYYDLIEEKIRVFESRRNERRLRRTNRFSVPPQARIIWQQSFSLGVRKHHVDKLIQAILPSCDDPLVLMDPRIAGIYKFARIIESDLFKRTNCSCEYINKVAVMVYSLSKRSLTSLDEMDRLNSLAEISNEEKTQFTQACHAALTVMKRRNEHLSNECPHEKIDQELKLA